MSSIDEVRRRMELHQILTHISEPYSKIWKEITWPLDTVMVLTCIHYKDGYS